jgi:hypothetical protein
MIIYDEEPFLAYLILKKKVYETTLLCESVLASVCLCTSHFFF